MDSFPNFFIATFCFFFFLIESNFTCREKRYSHCSFYANRTIKLASSMFDITFVLSCTFYLLNEHSFILLQQTKWCESCQFFSRFFSARFLFRIGFRQFKRWKFFHPICEFKYSWIVFSSVWFEWESLTSMNHINEKKKAYLCE